MSDRFESVEQDPEFEAAMTHSPRVASLVYVAAAAGFLGLSVLLALVGLALVLGLPTSLGFKLLWFAMMGMAVSFGVGALVRAWRFHAAPIVRVVGLVVATRTQHSRSSSNGTTSTEYFVTVQLRDGTRHEYSALASVVGLVTGGDIGIAYVKQRTLVGFRRFSA